LGRALAFLASGPLVGALVRRRRQGQVAWVASTGRSAGTHALAARVLGAQGSPILLLHGLVASGIYWGGAFDRLADDHRLIVPDLLGFGRSPRPATGYGADDHVAAVIACLDELAIHEPVLIGAHSLGTLVALRMAATHPDRVSAIVAFGPPLYPDEATARAHVAATGPMARLFVLPGIAAEMACGWVCRHRALAGRLAVLTHPGLPALIAADGVEHSWASYSETLGHVLLEADPHALLDSGQCQVRLVAGDADRVVDHDFLHELAEMCPRVIVERWQGKHDLPIARADDCVRLIRQVTELTSSEQRRLRRLGRGRRPTSASPVLGGLLPDAHARAQVIGRT
jgi:pimeloyl-ACP methyl ester carboxylesterase